MARTQRAVVATLAVRVPVNASGELADGAASIVERIDAVDAVADPEVQGLQPGLNDTVVEVRARVTLAPGCDGDEPATRRALADGVGVRDVVALEAAEADPPPVRNAVKPG